MKVLHVQHLNASGKVLWEQRNIYNTLHYEGEAFLLSAAFTGGRISSVIPDFYYLGMDSRSTLTLADTMDSLVFEPSNAHGYTRQLIASSGDFIVATESSHFVASSPIVAFRAQNGAWGPVSNLFLTNKADNTGSLIASATFEAPITVNEGDSITMRIAVSLRDVT